MRVSSGIRNVAGLGDALGVSIPSSASFRRTACSGNDVGLISFEQQANADRRAFLALRQDDPWRNEW
jgi:hypothetical protein